MKGECDSLTGSHLISSLIKDRTCSNLNEESLVSRVPTLASRSRGNVAPSNLFYARIGVILVIKLRIR